MRNDYLIPFWAKFEARREELSDKANDATSGKFELHGSLLRLSQDIFEVIVQSNEN